MSASSPPVAALRAARARERVLRVADAGSVTWLDRPRPSPHLARFGIAAQEDDGLVTAQARIGGAPWLVAAQDERFLGGSVGAAHGAALEALLHRAQDERPTGVLLLMASGGVRLHEANAAELALARALRALVALRRDGVRVDALAVGDVFGGASVLACATDRLGALPGVRLGLSGPKVIETAAGRDTLDAGDAAAVDAIFGVVARTAAAQVEPVGDDARAVATWLSCTDGVPFATAVIERQDALAAVAGADPRVGAPRALPAGWNGEPLGAGLWRTDEAFVTAPWGARAVDAPSVVALDAALLAHVGVHANAPMRLVVLEDSAGHAITLAAERAFLSRFLAHHACVLELMRARGVRVAGVLLGTGHSAAFFGNALQADALAAVVDARVVAMDPAAMARVTRVAAHDLVENDALLGHPVRHLAALGGIAQTLPDARQETVMRFIRGAG